MLWQTFAAKVKTWIRRYGVAECLGTLTALGGAHVGFAWTRNPIVAAYCGALGENCGFYGWMAYALWRATRQLNPEGDPRRTAVQVLHTLLLEFGPAEILDSLVTRPLAMGLASAELGRPLGTLVGKGAADVLFYSPVIASYELRQWLGRPRS